MMPPKTSAVVFDLDGTLYPEHQFVDGGFRAVATFLAGRRGGSAEVIQKRLWELHARDGRGRLFDSIAAELGMPADPEFVLACVLIYRTHLPRLQPLPGAVEALDAIHRANLRTGLLSDGLSAVQRRKLAALPAVASRLDVVVMTDELGPGLAKPSPVGFGVACRLLDVPPSQTIYVGNDPRKDFAGARKASLGTIRLGSPPDEGGGVDIATGGADDADVVAGSFEELLELVLRGSATGERKEVIRR